MKLKSVIKKSRHKLVSTFEKTRLKNHNFTIISDNCWGGEVYRDLDLPYKTPFVGLFLFAPCYIKLLKNLQYYLQQQFIFTEQSRYNFANQQRNLGIWQTYPIGILGGDIEVHFMHYSTIEEALEKWQRRTQRIEWKTQNIFVEFSEGIFCTAQLIEEFDSLNIFNKICFTCNKYPQLKSCTWIKEYQNEPYFSDGKQLYRISKKYFNIIDWLNISTKE